MKINCLTRSLSHIAGRDSKAGGKVEKVLEHSLAELHKGGDVRRLCLQRRGLTL
jgi:hypothetical protein